MSEDFLSVEVGTIKLSELVSPDYNPRKDVRSHPVFYERLHNSITKFNYANMIVVNKNNNHIVSGNQRYKVICDMVLDKGKKLEDVEISVQFVDMNEGEEMAANIAFNHISGDDDTTRLAMAFEDISKMDSELLEYVGMDRKEIDKLLEEVLGDGLTDSVLEDDEDDVVKEAVFEIKLSIPHEYFETYNDYVKENSELPLVQAIVSVIMGLGNGKFKR